MASTSNTSSPGSNERPSKRLRTPVRAYEAGPGTDKVTLEEDRMLAQAIANSRKDQGREPLTHEAIPFGPTFYPTVEEFSGDPLIYLEKVRPIAEKYGEFVYCSYQVLIFGYQSE